MSGSRCVLFSYCTCRHVHTVDEKMKCPSLIIACTFLIVSIYPTIAFNFGRSRSYAFSFPGRQTERSLTRAFAQVDVTVEKPLGITLEENEADEAKGVFCNSFSEESAAFVSVKRISIEIILYSLLSYIDTV